MKIYQETNIQNNLYKIPRTVLNVLVSWDITTVEMTNSDENTKSVTLIRILYFVSNSFVNFSYNVDETIFKVFGFYGYILLFGNDRQLD